jgi:hypothetical protein
MSHDAKVNKALDQVGYVLTRQREKHIAAQPVGKSSPLSYPFCRFQVGAHPRPYPFQPLH